MSSAKISVAIGIGAAAIIAVLWHQTSAARQDVKHLQEQVAADGQDARARAEEIQKLREQIAYNAKAAEAMARDAAKSRANASAARDARQMAEAARKAASAEQSPNALAAMFKDPDMVKAMKDQSAAMIRTQFGPLVKQLHLSDDQAEKFYQILIGNSSKGIDAMQSGNLSSVPTSSMESDLRAVLGDAGYDQYKDFSESIGDRTMLAMANTSFGDNPLSDQQQQQLLQAMKSARQSLSGNTPNFATLSPADQSAAVGQYIAQQEQINQNVLQQAAAFLSPDQLQSLATTQSNMLGMQKFGMTTAQKMFNNGNAPTGP